ncbi:hypothetical protein HDU81_000990 [Chytriomyces hyalinus]|nr:hypothetical protein HDU81_000990 [Chytriomyces hyalinus]
MVEKPKPSNNTSNKATAVLMSVMQRLDDIEQSLWTHTAPATTRESGEEGDMQVVEAVFDTDSADSEG